MSDKSEAIDKLEVACRKLYEFELYYLDFIGEVECKRLLADVKRSILITLTNIVEGGNNGG